MSVESRNGGIVIDINETTIDLTVPVTTISINPDGGALVIQKAPTTFTVDRRGSFALALCGIAHSDPGVLSEIIGSLRCQYGLLSDSRKQLVRNAVNSLDAVRTAMIKSEEL
ncbi:hypothetical protein KKE78_01040 [Patescibacteria group bacterium]|nr:hypothetical protein [Patescibacteria group bacterium]